jgi:hypothetical protein
MTCGSGLSISLLLLKSSISPRPSLSLWPGLFLSRKRPSAPTQPQTLPCVLHCGSSPSSSAVGPVDRAYFPWMSLGKRMGSKHAERAAAATSPSRRLRYHARMQERFLYEQSTWSYGDPERSRRWYEVLERTGPENVRARLAQTDAGSAGSISIGTEQSLTIGSRKNGLPGTTAKKLSGRPNSGAHKYSGQPGPRWPRAWLRSLRRSDGR